MRLRDPKKDRNILWEHSYFSTVCWSCAQIVCAAIYYGITQWRVAYGLFTTAIAIIGQVLILYIKETPKFLMSKGKTDEAIKQLDHIAGINKKPMLSEYLHKEGIQLDLQKIQYDKENKKKKYGYTSLFKFKSLRMSSFGFMIVSFALHIVYYGDQYGLKDISTGYMIFVMGAAIGFSELIANLIMRQVIHKTKRKQCIILSFIGSIVSCSCFFFYGFSSDSTKIECDFCFAGMIFSYSFQEIMLIFLACAIRIFNSFGFATQGLHANEFYPTIVRSAGTGFLYSCGILGSFFAPQVIFLSEEFGINPFFGIGSIAIVGTIGSLMLEETLGVPMKNQIEEETELQKI